MCMEDALGEGTGFEQREAEQHCVPHDAPDGVDGITFKRPFGLHMTALS